MGNYIKIDRKILEWEWYKNLNTCRLFFHMLLKANWKDGRFEGKDIPRGSFVSSINALSEETGLTQREVRTAISHLKMTGELTSKSFNRYSIFTIQNYCLYQMSDTQNDRQSTDNRQAIDRQATDKRHSNDIPTTAIEEVKNDSKEEVKQENMEECITPPLPPSQGEMEEKPKRKRFIPPTLEEVQAYCLERNNGIDAQTFIDFYESKGWMIGKNKMKDWKAAIRTWERGRSQNRREQGSRDILGEWRDS